ncbi:viroplasmin family protein [Clostridium perfringens]|uniref:ribonuclease H1 domain-containing protein n=1 Tax=Clostridium perfringens TaxID=1502 RepID=UPI0018D7B5AC|nr:ribonuclease H family protein [Clostridium perfringens]
MAKKFYAVKKGFKTGIFNTWDECKIQVDGFSGAIYKAFSNYEDASNFIGLNNKNKNNNSKKKDNINISDDNINSVEAYVDGSYSEKYKMYSYGVVILHNNEVIKFSGKDNDDDNISMRNVAGELLGATEAIKWALENKVKKISIYYDYEGIEKWALGLWKTNKKGTKFYKEFIDNVSKNIEIEFIKVKAHTGVYYNEEADRLAKAEINNIILNNNDIKINDESISKIEIRLEEKYRNIFMKIMSSDIDKKNKNQCITIFQGMQINDEKLKKVAKEIWKIEKRKISEIKKILVTLNIDEKIILIEIIDIREDSYHYKILL